MMNRLLKIRLLLVGCVIVLLLVVFLINRLISSDEGFDLQKLPICSSTPGYDSGPHTMDKITDLDPTFPEDSKAGFIIKHLDDTYEEIDFSTQEQLEKYLKSLNNYCLVTDFPPACAMGHFPGEPPGRKPCTIPTP
jgi:hypothetical protein